MACDTPKVDRAYEGLIRELDLIKKAQVSDAELQKAINNLIGNHLISLQSSSDRAETIGLYTLYGLGYDFDPIYINKIREVTAAGRAQGRTKVPGSGTLCGSQSLAGRRTKEEIDPWSGPWPPTLRRARPDLPIETLTALILRSVGFEEFYDFLVPGSEP